MALAFSLRLRQIQGGWRLFVPDALISHCGALVDFCRAELVMKKWLSLVAVTWVSFSVLGAQLPYDEHADAHAALQQGLVQARAQGKEVLLVFGANWCKDCRELDKALHGRSASLIDSRFVVVKVDVGNFDKNLDVQKHYGYPTGKGIPAAVVLSPDDKVIYATRAGELADARHMGEDGIYDFFAKVVPQH
jgi:protein disulfide-isomerase